MTTTPIKLDPKVKATINAIKKAHAKSGELGTFLALLEGSSHYYVQTNFGAAKYRYVERETTLTVHAGGKATTVKLEKPCHA
jgi:spore coat polysaccharide biosynthesis predicted glycosyltransferase SpsG